MCVTIPVVQKYSSILFYFQCCSRVGFPLFLLTYMFSDVKYVLPYHWVISQLYSGWPKGMSMEDF
jgi:hypothetical protein